MQEETANAHGHTGHLSDEARHRADTERFVCRVLGRYSLELDLDLGSLRLSWSGDQRFFTDEEISGLIAFWQEVRMGSDTCALCSREHVPAGRYCEKCQTLLSYIHKGDQLLDAHNPGWHLSSQLCLNVLNMAYHGRCLLSQLFGSFEEGILLFGLGPLLIEWDLNGQIGCDSFGWEYGFSLSPMTPSECIGDDYARLTALWIQLIAKKRLVSSLAMKEL